MVKIANRCDYGCHFRRDKYVTACTAGQLLAETIRDGNKEPANHCTAANTVATDYSGKDVLISIIQPPDWPSLTKKNYNCMW